MGRMTWRAFLVLGCAAALLCRGRQAACPAQAEPRARDGMAGYSAEFDRAGSLLREGKPAQALEAADKMVLARPEHYEGYYFRAYAYYKLNKPKEANEAVQLAAAHVPEDQKLLVTRLGEMVNFTRTNRGKHFPTTRPFFRAPKGDVRSHITGVVIDARGLKVERAMDPKIRLSDDSEVWGTKFVDPDYVIAEGIVVYARTMEQAETNKRCGRFPLVFKAISAGKRDSDVVLGPEDAKKLLNAERNSGFLNTNQVVFVIDD